MPLPVIAGLPMLMTFIGTLALKFFDWFITRKVGSILIAAAVIGLIYGIIYATLSFVGSKLSDILSALPNWPAELMPLFFPSDVAKSCLAAIIVAEIVIVHTHWLGWLISWSKKTLMK